MELYQLHCFRTVAECQSITTASQQLHVSQPSLSQTIQRLEKELGYPLFYRVHRKITLNGTGKILFERVCFIEQYLENTVREMNEINQSGNSVLYLQVSCASMLLTGLLVYLQKELPEIDFRIHQLRDPNPVTQQHCLWIVPEKMGEQDIVLLQEDIKLVLPAAHPLLSKDAICLNDLANEKFISLTDNWTLQQLVRKETDRQGFFPHVTMCFENPTLMRACLNQGLGIAFVPSVTWHTGNTDQLVLRRVEDFHIGRRIYLHAPDSFLTRQQRLCINAIKSYFNSLDNRLAL